MGSYSRHSIKNIQFKLATIIFLKLRYIDFFRSNFSNFICIYQTALSDHHHMIYTRDLYISYDDDHSKQFQRNLSS